MSSTHNALSVNFSCNQFRLFTKDKEEIKSIHFGKMILPQKKCSKALRNTVEEYDSVVIPIML